VHARHSGAVGKRFDQPKMNMEERKKRDRKPGGKGQKNKGTDFNRGAEDEPTAVSSKILARTAKKGGSKMCRNL